MKNNHRSLLSPLSWAVALWLAFTFLGCGSISVPEKTLNKCNKEQIECNSQANKSCGAEDSSCVKKMLTDPNWSAKTFDDQIRKCDVDYQKCLGLNQ